MVTAGEGARFPATGPFTVTIANGTDPFATAYISEVVQASARTTDTITISAATKAWSAGAWVVHTIATADLNEFLQKTDAAAAYQALAAYDVAGDILHGSGADASTRLALGTAGQVLRVNAGATAPVWGAAASGAIGDLLDVQRVKLTADQALTASSTTFQDVTALVLPIGANEEIEFEVILRAGAPSDIPDLKVGITGPSGAAMAIFGGIGPAITVTDNSSGSMYTAAIASFAGVNWLTYGLVNESPTLIVLKFTVINGTTAGNVQVQAAQNTSSTDVVTIYAGSSMKGFRWA